MHLPLATEEHGDDQARSGIHPTNLATSPLLAYSPRASLADKKASALFAVPVRTVSSIVVARRSRSIC